MRDTRGDAPDSMPADPVLRGCVDPGIDVAFPQVAEVLRVGELLERHLEIRFDLSRIDADRRRILEPSHNGSDDEAQVAGHVVDRPDHLDSGEIKTQLFTGLTERRSTRFVVLWLAPSAGKRDLAAVSRHVLGSQSVPERDDVAAMDNRDENGRLDELGNIERLRRLAIDRLPETIRADQQPPVR